jgi:hypothetical protein
MRSKESKNECLGADEAQRYVRDFIGDAIFEAEKVSDLLNANVSSSFQLIKSLPRLDPSEETIPSSNNEPKVKAKLPKTKSRKKEKSVASVSTRVSSRACGPVEEDDTRPSTPAAPTPEPDGSTTKTSVDAVLAHFPTVEVGLCEM